jgi:hypothetical protein
MLHIIKASSATKERFNHSDRHYSLYIISSPEMIPATVSNPRSKPVKHPGAAVPWPWPGTQNASKLVAHDTPSA